jgi:hypothetical protein
VGAATRAENAYALLDMPGEWYLDGASSKLYYIPLPGQDLARADVEAPRLEALIEGGGTAASPLHNVVFRGLQLSYATWLGPSGPNGFSEVQANYLVWGPGPTAGNAGYSWHQIPANVALTYDQNVRFIGDAFVHLGAAGLALGNGSQNDLVEGCVVTDVSGNGIEIGNDDMPSAEGPDKTLHNPIRDSHVFSLPVEFHGGVAIQVGYAAETSIVHNQIDHTPYSGVSIGWGGWQDKLRLPGLTNFSHNNDISNNLIFQVMLTLVDGGAIYTNGQTSASHSFATGETITGNVIHDQVNHGHFIHTDNGADWITATGNAMWNNGPAVTAWGLCHADFYAGEGGGDTNLLIKGNYWSGGPATDSTNPQCQVTGNTAITGQSGAPASILANAGVEPTYHDVLDWVQVIPAP